MLRGDVPREDLARAVEFVHDDEIFFLSLSMAASKLAADAARNVADSTLVVAMARNGTDFGIRVAGCGDQWFTAPSPVVEGLFLTGYGPDDAGRDMGDSAITETVGLGAFVLPGAMAILEMLGAKSADALRIGREMQRITVARHPTYTMPVFDFEGAPVGIDVRAVVDGRTALHRHGHGPPRGRAPHPRRRPHPRAEAVLFVDALVAFATARGIQLASVICKASCGPTSTATRAPSCASRAPSKAAPGVRRAAAMMCTPRNLDTLGRMGLAPPGWASPPKPDDLFIVVEAESTAQATEALDAIDALLAARTQGTGGAREGVTLDAPRTLAEGLAALPDARLALVSVPGAFAAREARRALEAGLNVMVFSNGVSVEEEVRPRDRLAAEKGRLVMGPDCGTALLDGVPLGFANAVRRGAVGVVGASGSGMQEFTCLVHQLGAGVSHAIGTGGRDLRAEVGGRTALAALARPSPTTPRPAWWPSCRSLRAPRWLMPCSPRPSGRPVVACFLGPHDLPARAGVTFAHTLEDAAPSRRGPGRVRRPRVPPRGARGARLGARAAAPARPLRRRNARLRGPHPARADAPAGSNLRFEGVAETLRFRRPGHLVLDMGEGNSPADGRTR